MADADFDGVAVPRELVLRGGRPIRGQLFRVGLATTGLLLGLSLPIPVGALVVTVMIGGAWLVPRVVDRWLARVERTHDSLTVKEARHKRFELERRWWVQAFAPHAWVALQHARLQLASREHREAAATLAECARMMGDSTHPALVEAQAHMLLLADDRRGVARCLAPLAERDRLSARGHLDYGIALLSVPGHHEEALRHLEVAQSTLAGPRLTAAHAAALARAGQADAASRLLARVPADSVDPLTTDLVRRARKQIRGRGGGGGIKRSRAAHPSARS